MHVTAFWLILIGGLLTLAGLIATVQTIRATNEARRARRSLHEDPGWESRQLPMHAGAPHLAKPDPASWDVCDLRSYVDDRLHSLDVMIAADLREGLNPLLSTRAAALGAAMLIAGVIAQTAGGLAALYL